jgi:ABC-type glycerol-3-phosphate transport system substrate-binding protein
LTIRTGSGSPYIAEPLEIFDIYVKAMAVHGTILYYNALDIDRNEFLCRIDLDNPGTPERMPIDLPPGQGIMWMDISGDGTINILASQWLDNDEYVDTFWHQLDESGLIKSSIAIGEVFDGGEWPFTTGFRIGPSGNAYICLWNSAEIYAINPQGGLAFRTSAGGPANYLFKDAAGTVYAQWPEGGKLMMAAMDGEGGTLGEPQDISVLTGFIGGGTGADGSVVLAGEDGAYRYDAASMTFTELLSWADLHIPTKETNQIFPLADGRLFYFGSVEMFSGSSDGYLLLRPATAAELEELALAEATALAALTEGEGNITLGTAGEHLTSSQKEAIVNFNKAHPASRIEIVEYGIGEWGLAQLDADIVSGKCPDILLLSPELSYGRYARMGLFQDLKPYAEGDDSFAWADFQENIIHAYEQDGKLYGMPVSFWVHALAGKAEDIGGRKEWDLDGLVAFADRHPGSSLFYMVHNTQKETVLELCLKANGGHIVDWEDDGTGFDRDLFIRMLEFANRFTAGGADIWEYTHDRTVQERFADGDIRLIPVVSSMYSHQYAMALFGGPVSYIGYPSEAGSGYLISSDCLLAISRNCKNSKTAWNFITYLLSADLQTPKVLQGMLPLRKSNLDELYEQAKEETGTIMGGSGPGLDYYQYEVRGATDEELSALIDLINAADRIRVNDLKIDEIIMEEAGAYFRGQKSAAEVADIVENRVGIYVKEMK